MAGYLERGVWVPADPHRNDSGGNFVRSESQFRSWLSVDSASEFMAEPGRYHLVVSLACPWAHRTLLCRALLGLDEVVSVSIVEPVSGDAGWVLPPSPDAGPLGGLRHLHRLYTLHDARYSGLATVPVLWDKATRRIVNNESSEIVRMLGTTLASFGRSRLDLYPEAWRAEIDRVNAFVYEDVNNGVYRCGFASSAAARDRALRRLFGALDELEERLGKRRYLLGDRITEADVRLFPTLVRFDAVYFHHFRCNTRRLADYPNLSGYARDLYQTPAVRPTVNLDHIRRHYEFSHSHRNPCPDVTAGADFDFSAPHDRMRWA